MADNGEQANNMKGSEEIYDNCCNPCLNAGKKKEARKYCVECGSHVCDQCVQDHNKFLALMSHQILDKFIQEPRPEVATNKAETIVHLTRCATHHGQLIDRFCGEHKELCCTSCVAIKHRSCRNVEYLRSIAKEDFKSSSECKEIQEAVESVKTKSTQEKIKRSEYLASLEREKDKLLQNFQHFQDDIIDRIKGMTETAGQKILARHKQYKTPVELDIAALDTVGSMMDIYSHSLSEDDGEKLFLHAHAGKTAAKEGEWLISELPLETAWKKPLPFFLNLDLKQSIESFELLTETTGDVKEACDFMDVMIILQRILQRPQCSSHQFLFALLHLYPMPALTSLPKSEQNQFQGFLKTAYGCKKCQTVSESATPFSHLPIPVRRSREEQVRQLEVFWVPANPSEKPMQFKLTVPRNGCIADLCDDLSVYVEVERKCMMVTDVYNHRFHKAFALSEQVSQILDWDDIFIYEVAVHDDNNLINIPFYMRQQRSDFGSQKGTYKLFGQPLLVAVPRHQCTYTKLYNLLLQRVARFVTVPGYGETWGMDQSNPLSEDGAFEKKPRKIFHISIVNSYGTAEMDNITKDGSHLKLSSRTYIAMDWCAVAKDQFYNNGEAESFNIHETMNSKRQKTATLCNRSISQCLEQLTAEEDMGDQTRRYCHTCKTEQPATRKTELWALPNILMIHLDRTCFEVKTNVFVDFPTHSLDLKQYVKNESEKNCQFDLIGVVNHDGEKYTFFCRNFEERTWYYLDETGIKEPKETEIVTKHAYGLVYQRREH